MNTTILVAGIALLALAIVFKSRLALALAVYKEKRDEGAVCTRVVKLARGQAHYLESYLDDLYGWAGDISVRRDADGTFFATVERGFGRQGPNDGQALYVNGRKLHAHKSVVVRPEDELLLRRIYSSQKLQKIELVAA